MEILYYISKVIYKLQVPQIRNSEISKKSKVCTGARINNSQLEKYSFVGPFSLVNYAKIGSFCSIAENVTIGPAEHPIHELSTSPIFLEGENCMRKNLLKKKYNPYKKTIIGNDVWIGKGAIVKAGITIDNGAVVAMGAVVTKNIGPYEIWGGCPAKKIGQRFSDDIIQKLTDLDWWKMDETQIKKIYLQFKTTSKFIEG